MIIMYTPTVEETRKEKLRIIDLVRPELREHALVDLTDFIMKRAGEGYRHAGFVGSVAYKIEALGLAEVIPLKDWTEFYIKRNIWTKRKPILYAITLSAIGLFFSIVAGITIALTQVHVKNCIQKGTSDQFEIKKSNTSVVKAHRETAASAYTKIEIIKCEIF